MNTEIRYASINEAHGGEYLNLDPLNPRLGRENTGNNVSQEKVLALMQGWTLEALSLCPLLKMASGLKKPSLLSKKSSTALSLMLLSREIARLAAFLRLLTLACAGKSISRKWDEIIANKNILSSPF